MFKLHILQILKFLWANYQVENIFNDGRAVLETLDKPYQPYNLKNMQSSRDGGAFSACNFLLHPKSFVAACIHLQFVIIVKVMSAERK